MQAIEIENGRGPADALRLASGSGNSAVDWSSVLPTLAEQALTELLLDLAGRYGVRITPVTAQPWGITEFVLIDPCGVCWHIGQNTPGFEPVGRLP